MTMATKKSTSVRILPADSPEAAEIRAQALDWKPVEVALGEPIKGVITTTGEFDDRCVRVPMLPEVSAVLQDADAAPTREPTKWYISPFEIRPRDVVAPGVPVDGTQLEVTGRAGAEAYHIREQGMRGASYRTEQRVVLATRLQLDPSYDPASLVGRVFLLPAGK